MKIKNLIIYSFISSIFLFSLISIWKILATLQGIRLENFNTQIIFILGFLFSFLNILLRDKINFIIKYLVFASIFVYFDGFFLNTLPIWYNIGVLLILYFFVHKTKKYNDKFLTNEHSTQLIIFDFLTLFGIVNKF